MKQDAGCHANLVVAAPAPAHIRIVNNTSKVCIKLIYFTIENSAKLSEYNEKRYSVIPIIQVLNRKLMVPVSKEDLPDRLKSAFERS